MNPTQDSNPADAGPRSSRGLPEDTLILLPVRDVVLLPTLVAPITISRRPSISAVQEAIRRDGQLGILLQQDPDIDVPSPADLHVYGTAAGIVRYITGNEGEHHVVCQGQQRFRVVEFLGGYPFYVARVQWLQEPDVHSPAIDSRMFRLKEGASRLLRLLPNAPPEIGTVIEGMTSASSLADFVAGLMDMRLEEKQDVLQTLDPEQRMDKVLQVLQHRVGVLSLSEEINRETQTRVDREQREYMLREQLRTIQRELGEDENQSAGIDELATAIARAGMPQEVEGHARKELRRLSRMQESVAEHAILRTYLEWLTELPWAVTTEDRIDIAEARRILDEDHCGLEKVKRRILEYLAVKKLNPRGKSPILCLAGPPGVGKTSLGQSIARATGRKFVRMSLGGVHDEGEIRGHRRTYIGAQPGTIIQSIRKAGSRNCVLMLDEMDKLGAGGPQGSPAAALLEVLDPGQNLNFKDHYLGVPFDLSEVMFIATANVLDAIPGPLRDRMETVHIPGYTEEEKLQIGRRYLLPRQLEDNGLKPGQLEIADAALRAVIREYTREAGVRNLDREIGNLCRHAAVRVAEGLASQVRVEAADLGAILGPARFENETAMGSGLPGVATGLAWTAAGGDILFIEASLTPGTGKLILTGQLGDVMKESVQAALTLVKIHAARCGLPQELLDKNDIHVHVPAGAIPKDGPSAGFAMFVALSSLLMNRPVRSDRAMTGEISLRGLVMPVGGIKEKVLAALQGGIKAVLLPARNRKDLEDIPAEAREKIQFIWLETAEEGLKEALAPPGS